MNPPKIVFANFDITYGETPTVSCDVFMFKELENGSTDMQAFGQIRSTDPADFLWTIAKLEAKDHKALQKEFEKDPILIAKPPRNGKNSRAKGKRKKPMHEKIPTPRELRARLKPQIDDGLYLAETDTGDDE